MSLPTAEDVAKAAGVEPSFVSRAVESGALGSAGKQAHFTAEDATRLRFLSAWDDAGLSVEKVGALVGRGELTFSFLALSVAQGPVSTTTYEELAKDSGIGLPELQRMHEALGFDPPAKSDPIRPEDRLLANLMTTLLGSGSSEDAVLRLLRVYSASMRRIAQAEAELFESEIEEVMRRSGASEQDLLDIGGEVGRNLTSVLDDTIHAIYRRHKQHVWLNLSITHIEMILESEGLYERLDRPPCVCFVDLTGYTTLTEQLGDQASAEIAARLGALVENISADQITDRGRGNPWPQTAPEPAGSERRIPGQHDGSGGRFPRFVLETTGSATRTGLTGAAIAVGAVVPSALGGPLVDRVGFKGSSRGVEMWRFLFIAFLIAHGAIHLAMWIPQPKADAPFDAGRGCWATRDYWPWFLPSPSRWSWLRPLSGFGLMPDWWRPTAVVGLAGSLGLMILFFQSWFLLIETANAALNVSLLWLQWHQPPWWEPEEPSMAITGRPATRRLSADVGAYAPHTISSLVI